jgi:putative oxidoreductase
MTRLLSLYTALGQRLDSLTAPLISPLLRIVFAAGLLGYYWASALTKVRDRKGEEGIFDVFTLEPGVYAQMFPKAFEAAGYNPAKLGVLYDLIAVAGTAAEFALPLLIVIGLFTRLAALGMIGFVLVQTWVDVTGHGGMLGRLFDSRYELIDERALWITLLLILAIKGGGALSLDRVLIERRPAAD